jgi:hypothetical protein
LPLRNLDRIGCRLVFISTQTLTLEKHRLRVSFAHRSLAHERDH